MPVKYEKAEGDVNGAVAAGIEGSPPKDLVIDAEATVGGQRLPVIGIKKLAFKEGGYQSVTLPASLLDIGGEAFHDCKQLKSVTILSPSQLKVVGHGAFWGCEQLQAFVIPASVEKLGVWAFRDCKGLKDAHVDDVPNSRLYKLGESCFEWCDLERFVLPKSVKKIQRRAFQTNWRFAELIFDDFENSELWQIESGAFAETAIKSILFPPKLKDYGSWMFFGAKNVAQVKFSPVPGSPEPHKRYSKPQERPPGVYHIGAWNFEETVLESFDVPASVETIEAGAFWNLQTLKRVNFPANSVLERLASNAFSNTPIEGDLILPASLNVLDIEVFQKTPHLRSLILPANSELEIIHPRAFDESGIQQVQLPGVKVIEDDVFKGCARLRVAKFALPTQTKAQQSREMTFPTNLFPNAPRVFVTYPTATLKKVRQQLKEHIPGDFQ